MEGLNACKTFVKMRYLDSSRPKLTTFAQTLEDGNIGGIVGPPFVAALKSKLGASNVAVQGVNNYPADIPGFLAGGSATGSANMASVRTIISYPIEAHCGHLTNTCRLAADPANHDPMPKHKALRVRIQPGRPGCPQCRQHDFDRSNQLHQQRRAVRGPRRWLSFRESPRQQSQHGLSHR